MSTVTIATGTIERQISDVRIRHWLLDALTVSSGSIDSISFLGLGKVFTAFMTGNVAFLGMGIAGNPVPRIVSVLASMAGFAVGIYFATRITSSDKQKSGVTWSPRTTFALGVSLLAHLCFVAIWFATSGRPGASAVPILLAVWALAMGLQSGAVRKLHVEGIFTTAATGTFIVLASDLVNWGLTRDERRRYRGVLISLVIGATAGAYLFFHAPIFAPVLPLVITAGVAVTAARVQWSSDAPAA
ncbi:YoaK family protein [Edaphobacter aggregans]|uniref:YoaK family protein n=1 Tax=Edaphobacter aggregans TaxID=570835 RepID=UPI00068CB0F2|nr:YoaK family protein [Edaphobacter aggregans]